MLFLAKRRNCQFPLSSPVLNVMATGLARAHPLLLVLTVADMVRFVCSKGFFQYSKHVQPVLVGVESFNHLVRVVMGEEDLSKIKSFQLKYRQVLIQA